jgi:hypothetical protein
MRLLPASRDRRHFTDRRAMDKGPIPWMLERRIRAERRGFSVKELDFDEWITLSRARVNVSE